MNGDKISIWGIEFQKMTDILPESDKQGKIIQYQPQERYNNAENLPLNKYGHGSFCKFKISREYSGKIGVYILSVNDKVRYVGETDDLEKRYNMGYGNISPRNCYLGGQQTNCRINKLILEEKLQSSVITLYFTETENRFDVEHYLILKLNPDWNHSIGKPGMRRRPQQDIPRESKVRVKSQPATGSSGRYQPLEQYLAGTNKNSVELKFSEIESILGFPLPESARKYPAWWSNGGHKHAYSWLNAGYVVANYTFGDYVLFKRGINNDENKS
jgi:hypothetical protein